MNQLIQKLADEAGLKVNADGEIGPAFFGSVDAGYGKFAQLIIAECCVALRPMLRDMISRTQAVDMIVTHFKD